MDWQKSLSNRSIVGRLCLTLTALSRTAMAAGAEVAPPVRVCHVANSSHVSGNNCRTSSACIWQDIRVANQGRLQDPYFTHTCHADELQSLTVTPVAEQGAVEQDIRPTFQGGMLGTVRPSRTTASCTKTSKVERVHSLGPDRTKLLCGHGLTGSSDRLQQQS